MLKVQTQQTQYRINISALSRTPAAFYLDLPKLYWRIAKNIVKAPWVEEFHRDIGLALPKLTLVAVCRNNRELSIANQFVQNRPAHIPSKKRSIGKTAVK